MPDLVWILVVTAASGGVGGFIARAIPGGVHKKKVDDAPPEAGIVVSTLGGAAAAVGALLGTESFADIVFFGPEQNLAVAYGAPEVLQAFGVGLVGLKWLINFQNGATLRTALAEAAGKQPNAPTATAATSLSPRLVLAKARAAP